MTKSETKVVRRSVTFQFQEYPSISNIILDQKVTVILEEESVLKDKILWLEKARKEELTAQAMKQFMDFLSNMGRIFPQTNRLLNVEVEEPFVTNPGTY